MTKRHDLIKELLESYPDAAIIVLQGTPEAQESAFADAVADSEYEGRDLVATLYTLGDDDKLRSR